MKVVSRMPGLSEPTCLICPWTSAMSSSAASERPAGPADAEPLSVGYRVEHDGHAVVLAGDTVPCAGLDELCAGADALVITVVRDDLIHAVGVPRLVDVCDYHSTVTQAADTAKRAGVGTLVLTHCVPPIPPGAEDEWRAIAAETFDGEILVAADCLEAPVSDWPR